MTIRDRVGASDRQDTCIRIHRTPEYKCRGMIAVRRNFAILDPFGVILSGGEHQFGWQRVHRYPVGFGGFE